MNVPFQQTSNDYRIEVRTLSGPVAAYHGDTLLAESSRARVMYETRLAPVIYFPPEDVKIPLADNPELRTFCPFKGTASYCDGTINGKAETGVAWRYRNALTEGKPVEGMIAFMPQIATRFDLGRNELETGRDGNIAGPIVDWVMREAAFCPTPEDLTLAVANKLLDEGVAISRMSVMIWSLHPMIAGRNYIWSKETGTVRRNTASYDVVEDPRFVNSPFRHVASGLGGVRQRLDIDEKNFDFPIMDELRAGGATDYVAMPMPFSNGQINVLTLTCDHPKGFTTPNLGLIFECVFVIGRFYEVFTLRENAQSLLETYLGRGTGARVLGGEIRRGDGDDIDAAILFCDLRNSSALEEQLGRHVYLETLNWFFEETTRIINDHGGEVLKFIGDAVLAIFPADDAPGTACRNALAASRGIVGQVCGSGRAAGSEQTVDCALGVAFGEVTYGNVGSRERLDFTVIGRATNIAARLSDFGKENGHRIVVTGDVAAHEAGATALGAISLRNVSDPVAAFVVA